MTLATPYSLLRQILYAPVSMESLTLREWDVLLPLARSTRLLARLGALARDVGIWEGLPDQVRLHMTGAEVQVGAQQRVAAWELDRLHRVLGECPFPMILLKGAAYLQGGLHVGRGRDFADVDILVPRTHIDEAENALKAAGWVSGVLSDYDERYYRDWMHEIPPLRHPDRRVEVDVHHTLLPVTGRIQLAAGRLFEESRPLPDSRFRILGTEDLVLHSATHLFTSGECERALRDLSDLDLLLRQFAAESPGYYDRLLRRAEELNLGRILYYALHGVHAALNTPIPEEVLRACDRFGPPVAWARFMNAVFLAAFVPEVSGLSNLARGFLFLRSHWLKMPFILLVRHLWTKAYASH